jgi:hypothetical protein
LESFQPFLLIHRLLTVPILLTLLQHPKQWAPPAIRIRHEPQK